MVVATRQLKLFHTRLWMKAVPSPPSAELLIFHRGSEMILCPRPYSQSVPDHSPPLWRFTEPFRGSGPVESSKSEPRWDEWDPGRNYINTWLSKCIVRDGKYSDSSRMEKKKKKRKQPWEFLLLWTAPRFCCTGLILRKKCKGHEKTLETH